MHLRDKRVLIDASMVRGGGGFTHVVNVLPELAAAEPEAAFRLLVRSDELGDAVAPAANVDVVRLRGKGPIARARFHTRLARRIARDFGADVYFSVAEYAPIAPPCPLVVSFRNPNVFTPLDQGWGAYQSWIRLPALRRAAVRMAARADRVLFVSHDSAAWIGDSIGLDPARRAVVHHGVDPGRWGPGEGDTAERSGILAVSSVYRYKNFVRLIEAWRSLAGGLAAVPDLTIVGDVVDREHARQMEAAREACGPLAGRVHIHGRVPYAEIARFYRRAAVFAFPSYLETFGHPMLEAMAAEVPIVAADTPVFHEVGGDAVVYCDPHDTSSIADALGRVLGSAPLRQHLVRAGRERAARFSWRASAERLAEVLAEVIAEGGPAGVRTGSR